MVLFSGQGAHIYGFDTTHSYGEQPRQVLVRYFRDLQDLPIDHVVSKRLIA